MDKMGMAYRTLARFRRGCQRIESIREVLDIGSMILLKYILEK
jgi:hypothetical protein